MSTRLQRIRTRIDELSLRERGLLFLSAVALLFMAWQSLVMDPIEARQRTVLEKITQGQQQVAGLEQQTQTLMTARTADPDAANRRAEAELKAALAALEGEIKGTVAGMVEPRQMPRMLEEVLSRNPGLKLKKVRSLAPTPVVEEEGSGATVYRHGLRLELEGSYLDALAYLQALQKLPRALYWDEVRIEQIKYPMARVTITVHTLSLSKGWIGV